MRTDNFTLSILIVIAALTITTISILSIKTGYTEICLRGISYYRGNTFLAPRYDPKTKQVASCVIVEKDDEQSR